MENPPSEAPRQVGLLVLEDAPQHASALKQILDAEGWRVRVVSDLGSLRSELKTGEYALLIANVVLLGVDSPLFHVIRELASVSADEGGRIRVLFVLPEMGASQYVGALESAKLPYSVRPFHLHDFLEKVSDLLVEVKAIEGPLRMTRYEFGAVRKKRKQASRTNSMFAARDAYSYTDEEMAEYERMELEASKNRRVKPRTNLGDPRS